MSVSRALLLAAGVLVLGVATCLTPTVTAEETPKTDPVLEVYIAALGEGAGGEILSKRVAAVAEQMGAQAGFVRTDAARVPDGSGRLLRATVWSSVETAEAAALASDGDARHAELVKSLLPTGQSRQFFRGLRTHTYKRQPTGHLEVTLYRTRVGTTREQNLARLDAAEADFSKAEGLLGHSTWIAPNGLWVHVVHWESEAAFNKTGKALMRTKGVGGWIRSLDFKRFRVWKGDRLN